MNLNIGSCNHTARVSSGSRLNCASCNAFISILDGKAAIKDPRLGGLHQTFPTAIFDRLLKETNVLPPSKKIPKSYLRYRLLLIDWLKITKSRLRLSDCTFHIAVKYMDYILSSKEYHQSKYQLIALTCLILAAKYDELDIKIPFPEDFSRIAKLPFHNYVIAQCEMLLLNILDWKLKIATAYTVTRCLLSQGVLFDTDKLPTSITPRQEHAVLLTRAVDFLVEHSLRSTLRLMIDGLTFVDQGKLAVALVLCGRKAVGVEEVWNPKLQEMTSYSWEDIEEVFELAWK
eukprot:TRINITY_DN9318_c0_g6_i1.p1 TRINITY_DN9318_c0_g6~~TRINITY_DN9318_c0_g6_i1.p1  ORF type:complete len:288 (+),score=86.75 TRINITY_DN9318_c0_g6_i1:192-1055(+)